MSRSLNLLVIAETWAIIGAADVTACQWKISAITVNACSEDPQSHGQRCTGPTISLFPAGILQSSHDNRPARLLVADDAVFNSTMIGSARALRALDQWASSGS